MIIDEISKKLIELTGGSFTDKRRLCAVLCGKEWMDKITEELNSRAAEWPFMDKSKLLLDADNNVTFVSGIAVKFRVINTNNLILYGSNYKEWNNTVDGNTQIAIDKLENLDIITITNIR